MHHLTSQQAQNVKSMLVQRWYNAVDGGATVFYFSVLDQKNVKT